MWAVLSLLLIVSSAQQIECPVFSCAPPGTQLADNVCLEVHGGNYWMSLCPGFDSKIGCIPSDDLNASLQCGELPEPEIEPSYPGEPCDTEFDCIANQTAHCIENRCTGLPMGENCAQDYDCGVGLFCDLSSPGEGKCTSQYEFNSTCTRDQECLNFLGCTGVTNSSGVFPGACIPYYSLGNGEQINLCVDNDGEGFSRLCESGTCSAYNSELAGPGICIAGYVSVNSYHTCTQDSDCVGKSGTLTTTKSCQCGYSSSSNTGFCPLFSGDQAATEVLQFTQELLKTNMTDCHTSHRFADFCFMTYLDTEFDSYKETVELATNYFLYQQNDNCVKGNLLNDFYQFTADDLECPAYSCASILSPSQCVAFNQGDNTYELTQCSGGDVCNVTSLGMANITCSVPQNMVGSLYPGDNCTVGNQCISGNCPNGICVGTSSGGGCDDSSECDVGLYCSSFFCVSLLEVGSSTPCFADSDCVLNAGCNLNGKAGGVCTAYFSLHNNDTVSCPQSGFQPLCESTMCAHESGLFSGQCVTAAISNGGLPVACNSDSDCIDSTNTYTSKCTCGFNPTGSKFCTLFPGDSFFVNYTTTLKPAIMDTNSGNVCQTTRRFEADCIVNIQKQMNSDSNELLSAYYYATMYPRLQKNDACVQSIFTSEYWSIPSPSPNNNNTNNTSMGVELTVAGIMWLTFE